MATPFFPESRTGSLYCTALDSGGFTLVEHMLKRTTRGVFVGKQSIAIEDFTADGSCQPLGSRAMSIKQDTVLFV